MKKVFLLILNGSEFELREFTVANEKDGIIYLNEGGNEDSTDYLRYNQMHYIAYTSDIEFKRRQIQTTFFTNVDFMLFTEIFELEVNKQKLINHQAVQLIRN